MIRVLVDSASDYAKKEAKEKGFDFISLTISLQGKDYRGGVDLEGDQFYELLVNTEEFPKTSQPSPQDFLTVFEDVKEKGDELICILLSSALSGTYQSAVLAKAMVEYEKIYFIDSLAVTHMIRILAEEAREKIQEGMPAEQILSELEELKGRIKVSAMVDTLEYLCKGGRLSKAAATIGEMARLKPLVHIDSEGKVGIAGKALGKNKAMSSILKILREETLDPKFPLYPVYTYGTENCEAFEEKLRTEGYAVKDRLQIGATIGAHVGPGAMGVIYVTESREC